MARKPIARKPIAGQPLAGTGAPRVAIQRLPHARGLPLPAYQSAEAAGIDLMAAVPADAPMCLAPMERALVPTGLVMALPRGFEAQVRPRSGLAFRHGITVLNSPGTIDSDYRGEVKVLLVNLGTAPWTIERGERIAQLVVQRVEQASLAEVDALEETVRGAGGFGSTGTAARAGSGGAKKSKPSSGRADRAKVRPRSGSKPVR